MSEEIRGANARELLAQTRRLLIEFCQLRALTPAFIQYAQAPRSLERHQTRADLAAQQLLRFGD